jgi:hypothetical protein
MHLLPSTPMNPINVNRLQLIAKVQANRDDHAAANAIAEAAYREVAAKWLHAQLELIGIGHLPARSMPRDMPQPEDHTGDYDGAIAMLQWSTDDRYELDESTFANLVLNQWHWSGSWAATNSSYSSSR